MKKILIFLLILSLGGGGYYFVRELGHNHSAKEDVHKQKYTCPMHPQIIDDKPGNCPICGMKLVPLKDESALKPKKTIYKSTMNPNEFSDKPGKDSMGMEMVPVEDASAKPAADIKTPEGLAPVTITQEKRKVMGLAFETVKQRNITKEITTSVKIVQDETRQFKVTTKVSGWVDKLYVNHTGQFVSKGSPLLSVYSPDLLTAQQEYLSAIKAKDKLTGPAGEGMNDSIDEIVLSAKERLRLLDLTDSQIANLAKSGTTQRSVILYSPASGYVTEKMVVNGQKIMMNDPLMNIVDLSKVWGEADIYESDLAYVKQGMSAEVTLPYWPGKKFPGKIFFLSPILDPDSRTLKAHIEIPNTGMVLKPNMFGEAKLHYGIGKRIAVPESAVMQTGTRNYVFIEGKDDLIVPYEIQIGVRSSDGFYEVISGVKSGEKVVTSANFLIDSESSLRAAFKSATEK